MGSPWGELVNHLLLFHLTSSRMRLLLLMPFIIAIPIPDAVNSPAYWSDVENSVENSLAYHYHPDKENIHPDEPPPKQKLHDNPLQELGPGYWSDVENSVENNFDLHHNNKENIHPDDEPPKKKQKTHHDNPIQELGEGIKQGAIDLVEAAGNVVIHPVKAIKDVEHLIEHPIESAENIGHAVEKECSESGWKCAGEGIFIVGSTAFGGEALEAVHITGTAAHVAEAAELTAHADEIAVAGNPRKTT